MLFMCCIKDEKQDLKIPYRTNLGYVLVLLTFLLYTHFISADISYISLTFNMAQKAELA